MLTIAHVAYDEHGSTPRRWELKGFDPVTLNLIVGKNATGKSRILNVLNGLASLIVGGRKLQYKTGNYTIKFRDSLTNEMTQYELSFEDQKIVKERFLVDGRSLLDRVKGGTGKIFASKLGQDLDFQTPDDELAVVARRDSIQHSFFEPLHDWANSVRYYPFGTPLGRDTLAVVLKGNKDEEFNPKEHEKAIIAFLDGRKRFGNAFINQIKEDMEAIGYSVAGIDARTMQDLVIPPHVPAEPVGISVQEVGLACSTDQTSISQGMFRALALIIHLAHATFSETKPGAILIDDIGEGLDFERACSLIDVILDRSRSLGVQLVMTTNDRHVMNQVPLEYWAVVVRTGSTCEIFTERTNPEVFRDFRLTGLNNVDFLTTDFISTRVH